MIEHGRLKRIAGALDPLPRRRTLNDIIKLFHMEQKEVILWH